MENELFHEVDEELRQASIELNQASIRYLAAIIARIALRGEIYGE